MLKRLWREDEGVLTFEWILLLTVIVIGTTGGLCAVRDALNKELSSVALAIIALNTSSTTNAAQAIAVGSPASVTSAASPATGGIAPSLPVPIAN